MELIKFITAGNVDDGKSTLIGRLLYDSNAISNDILESIQQSNGIIHLAHLTDGLKAEREQGITIDVAYKYFSTDKRKFIIADCPGHKEYTRNMITGASHADLAIILIDATIGITEQTKRHTFISDLMNIPFIIFCVNKMDAVGYAESVYRKIVEQINTFQFINKHQIEIIPVSALNGDNVVHRSNNIPWYNGPTLLHLLETYQPIENTAKLPAFLQVQYVSFQNQERYFFGTLLNGNFEVNQEIIIYPTLQKNKIKDLYVLGKATTRASQNQAIALTLQDDNEVQRGYYLAAATTATDETKFQFKLYNQFSAICFWFDTTPLIPSKRYFLQHHSLRTFVKCQSITEVLDLDVLKFIEYNHSPIEINTIFKAQLISAQPLLLADYTQCATLGSFIIIDETTHKTVGAGIVVNE